MAHQAPQKPRDHLWVVVIIAACCLLEVWASWVTIGSESGFPKIGGPHGLSTDWTLAVTTEAYWGYALYSWLAASPGPRSRRFAMWSAAGVFILSLTGQGSAHLVKPGAAPPAALVVFVTALPVIVLAAIAILVHFRQADREAVAEAVRRAANAERQAATERAEADERTALRAELAAARDAHEAEARALRDDLEAERAARTEAQREAELRAAYEAERNEAHAALEDEQAARQAADAARAEAERRAEDAEAKAARLTRKLEANGTRKPPAKEDRNGARTTVPSDVDARAEALRILADNPGISGAKLGELCGKSERWGQLRKSELAAHVADGTEGGAE